MFIELHLLQNFAPSCLNRDDTNSPKDCDFGGYRRARISSQCLKRAIRTHFRQQGTLQPEDLAVRTRKLTDALAEAMTDAGKDPTAARQVAAKALGSCGLGVKDGGQTEYLLFIGNQTINRLAELCREHWEALLQSDTATAEDQGKKSKKKAAQEGLGREITETFAKALQNDKAVDLALFGRMVADLPENNINAACQVAHAVSTHQVSMEFDFYTAVDDLQPQGKTGAGMMGTVEFNSACFYRYANIDWRQLVANLGGDEQLARQAVDAFLTAAVQAVPTGKQTSMAAQNPPSLVFAVVRQHGLWSLANAFAAPVRPTRDASLIQQSVRALEDYWQRLTTAYGQEGINVRAVLAVDSDLSSLQEYRRENLTSLKEAVLAALPGGPS